MVGDIIQGDRTREGQSSLRIKSSSMGPGQREKPAREEERGRGGVQERIGEPEQLVSWKPRKDGEAHSVREDWKLSWSLLTWRS